MGHSFQLADVLGEYVKRSGYTPGQLSKLSSIPKPTIVNWLEGRVRKPRGVEDLLLLAVALHLTEDEASRLLTCAGHPSVENLRITAVTSHKDSLLQLLTQIHPPLHQSAHTPFQAFADDATFVGRQKEMALIYETIFSDRIPKFISIQGMGGVGKTALAIHMAHQLRQQFPDGVLWAKVSQSDSQSILFAFASAYGADVSHLSDPHIRSQTVRDLLADKRALIILDDVESSAQITPLLPPSLKGAVIWTTRRQDLSILRQAVQVHLRPFDVELGESMDLFSKVLGDEKVEAERPYFQQISHLLGHLPLAIDIAASRMSFEPDWTAREFIETLQQEVSLIDELKFEENDIRLSFLTSLERLDSDLKKVFHQLTVFGISDFSVDACSEIFGQSPIQIKKYFRQLYGLSLISIFANKSFSETRYQLHALIYNYLKSKFSNEQYEQQFGQYYLKLLQANPNDFSLIHREYTHLLHSLSIANKGEEIESLSQLVHHLYAYWEAIGDYHVAQFWLECCVANSSARNKFTVYRLDIIFDLGRLQERIGNYIEAESYYEDALLLARELDATFQLSHILRRLGVLSSRRSDYVLAEAYYKEGIQLARRMNGGNAISDFLRGLGVQAYMMGQFAKAESFYEEGLSLMHLNNEQARQPQGQIGRIWGLGTIALEQGDLDEAESHFEVALQIAGQIDHKKRTVRLLRSLGSLHLLRNDLQKAKTSFGKALGLSKQIGVKWQEARIEGEIGEIEFLTNQIDLAEAHFRRQYELARILNSPEIVAISMFGLARVTKQRQNLKMTQYYAMQSLDLFISIGHENVKIVTQWIQINLKLT